MIEVLEALPPELRYEIIEDITQKSNTQSGLARKQRELIRQLKKHSRQGQRNDLAGETCTPSGVQVSGRRVSNAEKVGCWFGEGGRSVQQRIEILTRAEENPSRYGKYLAKMDALNSPSAAYNQMRAAELADRIALNKVPRQRPSNIRIGDRWILGRHRLLCGDATSRTDVENLLDGAIPNLMVTDPPYGTNYDPQWRVKIGNSNPNRMGRIENDWRSDWSPAWDLFPGNVCYIWHSDIQGEPLMASLRKCGFQVRNVIVWGKSRPVISRGHYSHQKEHCLYAVRVGKSANWQGPKTTSDLWMIDNEADRGHGHSAQKPLECMLRPIQNNSIEADAVYDPFVGSGTTIIAAEESGRACYAMELVPDYCAIAIKRWQDWTGSQAILELTGETFARVEDDRSRPPG